MVYIARLIISGRQKIALLLLAVCIVLFFSFYPRITEALLAFLLGGEVPGTNIVVSPDIVLATVILVFVLMTVLTGLRVHFNRIRRNHTFVQIPVKTMEKIKIPVEQAVIPEARVSVKVQPVLPRRHRLAAIFAVMGRALAHATQLSAIAGIKVYHGLRSLVRVISVGVSSAAAALATVGMMVGRTLYQIAKLLAKWLRATAVFIGKSIQRAWQRVHHALRRFDTWLELQVRKIEMKAAKKIRANESFRTATTIGREYRKSIQELHPKMMAFNARLKAQQLKNKKAAPTPER